MTISVTQAVKIGGSPSSMEMILLGMVLDVVSTTPAVPGTPWFLKNISPPTSDDIEMRLLLDENQSNEDISLETLEIICSVIICFGCY